MTPRPKPASNPRSRSTGHLPDREQLHQRKPATKLTKRPMPITPTLLPQPHDTDHDITSAEGEYLDIHERLIVATTSGLFDFLDPPQGPAIGDHIGVGQSVATVGNALIASPFAGVLMGMLAIEGERVAAGQPIAWLRQS